MRTLLFLLLACLISGCASGNKAYELPEQFAPLKEIRERGPALGAVIDGPWMTTIGEYVYVENLDEWLTRNPPGSVLFEAKLYHEQVHAERQLAHNVYLWIANYVYDTNFALEEEKLGWYRELLYLRSCGQTINVEGVARALSRYKNLSGKLISYEDALTWVRDVLADRWHPLPE